MLEILLPMWSVSPLSCGVHPSLLAGMSESFAFLFCLPAVPFRGTWCAFGYLGQGVQVCGWEGFCAGIHQAMLGGGLFTEASGTFPVLRGCSLTFLSASTLRTMHLLGSLDPHRSLPTCPVVLSPTKETICGSLSLVIEKGCFPAFLKGFMGPGFWLCPWEKLE